MFGFLRSKTFWFNTLAIGAEVISGAAGIPIPMSPATKMYVVAGINIVLRAMTTKPLSGK